MSVLTRFFGLLSGLSLGRRIVITLAVWTIGLAGFYTCVLHYGFEFVEHHLVGELLRDSLSAKVEAVERGQHPAVAEDVFLYSDRPDLPPIPERIAHLPPGFWEIDARPALFLYRIDSGGFTYFLVKNQDKLEDQEAVAHTMLWGLFGIICLVGILLGFVFYRLIMTPVKTVTRQVLRAGTASHYTPIPVPAPKDEISHLAQCCNLALSRLHSALEREQSFSGDVSHEFRTPLNVVTGVLELLEMDENRPDREMRQIARGLVAARDMRILIDNLLELARDSETFDTGSSDTLPMMIARMKMVWAPVAARKGVIFDTETRGHCNGIFSPMMLGSVINNLCRNAVNFTSEGRVTLIETDTGFMIEDCGGGIPDEVAVQMFERGFSGRTGAGAGIGLSLVRRICNRFDWTVTHENIGGDLPGSRFTVTMVPGKPQADETAV